MADNIELNAQSGTAGESIATDEGPGGKHYQKIKLFSGVADSTTAIGTGAGTEATSLRVTLPTDGTGQLKLAASAGTSIGSVLLLPGSSAVGSVKAAGAVAHSAAGTAILPLLQGGIAMEMDGTTLDPVAVAASDLTYMRTDRDGRQLVNGSHPASGSYNLETSSAQTATECVAQPGAGFSVYITGLYCSAITAQTLWIHDEDDTVLIPLQYFGANTGTVRINLSSNPVKVTAVKAVEVTSTAGVAHSILLQYYIAP
jgi:hypothetical protein